MRLAITEIPGFITHNSPLPNCVPSSLEVGYHQSGENGNDTCGYKRQISPTAPPSRSGQMLTGV